MALKNSQYYALMREYEQTRLKNHDLQMKRYEEVYKKLPEFKSLDESISILSVQYGKKMLNGDPKALSFYMNSPISKNFRQKHLSTILTLIFIRLPSMIKQREKTPAL